LKTIFFRIGKLAVYVSHNKVVGLRTIGFRQSVAKMLWPGRARSLSFPPLKSISTATQENIAGALGELLDTRRLPLVSNAASTPFSSFW